MFKYQKTYSLEKRKSELTKIRSNYTDRIPIIAEVSSKSDFQPLEKCKYLCPSDMTLGQFIYILNRRLKLTDSQAMFVFINNQLFPTDRLMSDIYKTEKSEDGFLYCLITSENTFG